jgi:hypothetical protein
MTSVEPTAYYTYNVEAITKSNCSPSSHIRGKLGAKYDDLKTLIMTNSRSVNSTLPGIIQSLSFLERGVGDDTIKLCYSKYSYMFEQQQ